MILIQVVGDFLDSIISNEDLKLILLGNLGYFHDDPYSLSLAYYTIAEGSYYTNGASFIKGGSQRLSDHLAAYIYQPWGRGAAEPPGDAGESKRLQGTGVSCRRRNNPGRILSKPQPMR